MNEHVVELLEDAEKAFDRSIEFDKEFYDFFEDSMPAGTDPLYEPRVAIAYWDRARLRDSMGRPEEAESDRAIAVALNPEISDVPPIEERVDPLEPMLDMLSWDDDLIGKRLQRFSNFARHFVDRAIEDVAAIRE